LAAQLAAQKLKGNVKSLEKEYSSMLSAANAGNWKKYYDHALVFHQSIIEASDNLMLLNTWHSVVLENRYKLTVYRRTQKELVQVANEHGPIIKALEKGDGQTAGRLLKQLIESYSFAHIEPHKSTIS
jgi:DNA-binding GntR family transcriptional regulator